MAKRKKQPGHFCKICGERKANEKFSGKGHAAHICKQCQSLPAEEQADMRRIRDVERIMDRFPFSRKDWELLEKYAKKYASKESGEFAQFVLDSRRGHPEPDDAEEEIYEELPFTELDADAKEDIRDWLHEELFEYILRYDKVPEGKYKQKMIFLICHAVTDVFGIRMQTDDAFDTFWNEVTGEVKVELDAIDVENEEEEI